VQFDHVLVDGLPGSAVRAVSSRCLPISDHCALAVDLDLGAPSRPAGHW
jgi:hypothetical protein